MTRTHPAAAEVAALLEYAPDLLFAELEIRRREITDDPALAAAFAPAGAQRSVVTAPLEELREAGLALFGRASPAAHALACGPDEKDAPLRQALRAADGRPAFAATLADALAASGALPPALAVVAAALAARLFVSDANEVMCAAWSAHASAFSGADAP